MQSEDSDDMLMSDIHYMTEQGWTDMLDHLTRLHKLRDALIYRNVLSDCGTDMTIREQVWGMQHGS